MDAAHGARQQMRSGIDMSEMPELMQKVESPAEELALQVAREFCASGKDAAGALFNGICEKHGLTRGEAAAFSHVAVCMMHGKRWKKCNKSEIAA
jgi:hypothetical protein